MRLAATHNITFFPNSTSKDVAAGSTTQPIFFTMNSSPLTFAVDGFLLGFFFSFLFCFVSCRFLFNRQSFFFFFFFFKNFFISQQEFVRSMGYSKAPELLCSARPIYHSHAMTNTGRKLATICIAAQELTVLRITPRSLQSSEQNVVEFQPFLFFIYSFMFGRDSMWIA